MASTARRIWIRGEANVDGPRPLRRLAAFLGEAASAEGIEMRPWPLSSCDERTTAATTATWNDPDAGTVTAGIVPRDGQVAACEWSIVADADKGWSPNTTPPNIQLGLNGEDVCDPSGVAMSSPLMLPVERETHPAEVEAMAKSFAATTRSVGILAVVLDPRRVHAVLEALTPASWPGLITVALLSEHGRQALAQLVPDRPIPTGGGRYFAASVDGIDDVLFGNAAVRQTSAFTKLFTTVVTARARSAPTGPAADAAALLPAPEPCPPPWWRCDRSHPNRSATAPDHGAGSPARRGPSPTHCQER
jgi:hypothetical protein